MSYLGCHYPGCGEGHVVRKKFCPRHLKTPFFSVEEIRAYKRGKRDGKAEAEKVAAKRRG